MKGTIKKIFREKGIGFITTDEEDVFFHQTSIKFNGFNNLQEGDVVEFSTEEGEKGPRAINMRVLEKE